MLEKIRSWIDGKRHHVACSILYVCWHAGWYCTATTHQPHIVVATSLGTVVLSFDSYHRRPEICYTAKRLNKLSLGRTYLPSLLPSDETKREFDFGDSPA